MSEYQPLSITVKLECSNDAEIQTITAIFELFKLQALDAAARKRVLDYLYSRIQHIRE